MIVRETRIKVAGIKQEEDQRCPKTKRSFWTEFIFFRGKTFIHAKDSNELAEYEKEKKRRRGRKRKRFLRDPRTRHPPIYITASSTRTFSSNPPSFAGVRVSRSTAFSRNFVLSEELKMVHQELAIWFRLRQKYRYLIVRGLSCHSTFNIISWNTDITEYSLCQALCKLVRFEICDYEVTSTRTFAADSKKRRSYVSRVRVPRMHDFSHDAYERAEKVRASHLKNELESLLTLLMLHHAPFRHVLAKVYFLIRPDCDPWRKTSVRLVAQIFLWLNDCIAICWQCSVDFFIITREV